MLRKCRPSPGNQRTGPALREALRHGFEPRLESLALRLGRIDWMPARRELRAALVLCESADSGRVVGNPYLTGLGKGCPSSEDNPILRRSMRIQHHLHVKIPETILAGGGRSR